MIFQRRIKLKPYWLTVVFLFWAGINSYAQFDTIPDLVPIEHKYEKGNPFLLPIWSPLYELEGNNFLPGSPHVEATLYEPYNHNTKGWWDNVFEEMRHGGVHASLILTRADQPERVRYPWKALDEYFIDAIERNNVKTWMKFGQFEASGAFNGTYDALTGNKGHVIDWSNEEIIDMILWELSVKRFRDLVPKELWLRYNGRPVTMYWGGTRDAINAENNLRKAFERLRVKFKNTYGEDPLFILPTSWTSAKTGGDITIKENSSIAVHPWFSVPNDTLKGCKFRVADDYTIGVCVPGFRKFIEDKNSPDYGKPREHHSTFDRNDKDGKNEFQNDISYMNKLDADFLVCESWVNQRESAGFYRSDFKNQWDYANQYINLFHKTNDPLTKSRRFQFEACDFFKDNSAKNLGGKFAFSRALDVDKLPTKGWYVGWVEADEWVQWKEPYFADNLYDIYIQYASEKTDNRIVLSIGSSSDTITLPSTGDTDTFKGFKMIEGKRMKGKKDIKVTFLTPDINADYLHFAQRHDAVSIGEANHKNYGGGIAEKQIRILARPNSIIATFDLADEANIKLLLFNSRGQQVIKTLNKKVRKGRSNLSLSHALNPGIYYMRTMINKQSFTNSIIID